ncbi:MAG: response regulator transcription factor [Lachnospiraceae bacterium]|nr:response regulator transcription factor [Lachnospiraceae bacterium]
MIKVMIIDDEPQICSLLCKMVEKQPDYQVVAKCGDFKSAMLEFTKNRPDVAFVDIDLNGEDGLECAKVLTNLSPKLKVIFATAHSEYMANAFEIYAFDYLVKPFNLERLTRTLERIRDNMLESTMPDKLAQSEQHKDKLLVKGKEQTFLIDIKDILMIERIEGATNIVTTREQYRISVSLSEMEERLNGNNFMRCHKSYIVNLSQITKIEPYGRWTYVVRFQESAYTALMTAQNYEALKQMFS